MLWLTVMHTFIVNGAKLAEWSKWFRTTLQSCFCSLLTLNWEVTAACSLKIFLNFTQIAQKFVIISYIKDIKTNLWIGKHTLRVFTWYFEKLLAKIVGMFRFCVCLDLLHFVTFLTSYDVVCCHACIWSCFCSLLTSNYKVIMVVL